VDLLYICADHQEAQTQMGLFESAQASFPCCLCLCPQKEMGNKSLAFHRSFPARTTEDYLSTMGEMLGQMEDGRLQHNIVGEVGKGTLQRMICNA
jgi:hypothetical protein